MQRLLQFVSNRSKLPNIQLSIFKRYYGMNSEEVPSTHCWNISQEGAEISCLGSYTEGSGIILGIYPEESESNRICFTKTGTVFNKNVKNLLADALRASPLPKVGEVRVFSKMDPSFDTVVVVGVGDNNAGYKKSEARDESKENIRKAVGAGVQFLQKINATKIYVEGFDDPESAAEGACLAVWENHHLLPNTKKKVKMPNLLLYGDCDMKKWRIGVEKAEAQNFARKLMETPANLMTPRYLSYAVVQALMRNNVNVTLRGERWLKDHHMDAFLENTRGSPQAPALLELNYVGCEPDTPPIILIGKGLTFNAGGLCLKSCKQMRNMRGDMAGAAAVVGAFKAISSLGIPLNVMGLLCLGENMPGSSAGRPMDIVKSASGKSILVGPRDFGGGLMLADAICYAQRFKPKYIVSVATLTKEIAKAFGLAATGLFTNNEKLWQLFKTSAIHTGDRVWKCPLWKVYDREVVDFSNSDLSTYQRDFYPRGVSCNMSAFLNQFNCHNNWAHMDIRSVMYEDGKTSYLKKGMSGRPTRTLIEFLGQVAYPPDTDGKIPPGPVMPNAC